MPTRPDTANDRATSRSALGLSRELQRPRTDMSPNPAKGGTRGYPVWFRTHVLTTANTFGREAAADTHNVNGRSIVKWESRITPHRMTGGQEKSAQVGMD